MKPNKLITIFLFIALLFAFSCNKSDEKQLSKEKVDYDKIGVMHNQGLDYAFNALKKAKEKGSLTKSNNKDYLNLLYESTVTFNKINSSNLTDKENTEVNNSLEETKKLLLKLSNSNKNDGDLLYQSILKEADVLLTAKQKEFSEKVLNAMSDTNIVIVLSNLDLIESEINLNCTEEEKPGLLAMVSVAKHSSQYWHQNLAIWVSEFGTSKNTAKFSWSFVGKSDALYAVLTGVGCSEALIVPFVGWGVYIGVVGGGTILVSGWACIAQLIYE
ncbi:MAG: hypothetical protein AB9846_14070 [Tenuifilaceae bacterium]